MWKWMVWLTSTYLGWMFIPRLKYLFAEMFRLVISDVFKDGVSAMVTSTLKLSEFWHGRIGVYSGNMQHVITNEGRYCRTLTIVLKRTYKVQNLRTDIVA